MARILGSVLGVVLSLGLAAAFTRAADPTPSALEQSPGGWTDLLANAGSNLEGWTRVPIPPTGKLSEVSQWSLDTKTGTLVCEGNGGHDWVRWNKELGDCILHVEWRFTPIANGKRYNSGIFIRNSEDGTIWHQAQTGDASGGFLFGDTPVDGTRKRVNLSKEVTDKRVKPAGEWNTFEVTCKGKDMSLWVNGAVTCEWHGLDVPKGYVGLEAEGFRIEFRNVKVKPL
jgi:Domain of Unknown Function (DUF1080)